MSRLLAALIGDQLADHVLKWRATMESQSRLGLFVSYDEEKHGKFQDAVDVCAAHGYVVWMQKAAVDTKRFRFPTPILIKIKEKDRYYRGELRDIKRAEEIDRDALLADTSHRPASWQQVDKGEYFKSVLYIAGLKQVPRPAGIAKDGAPQHPHYKEAAILRDSPLDELEQVRAAKEEEGAFSPSDLEDARKRIIAAIVVRQGQSTFRVELLAAY